MEKILENDFYKAIDYAAERCLDPNQFAGAWFSGSKEEFEEWAGDVLPEFLEYFLTSLGFEIDYKET